MFQMKNTAVYMVLSGRRVVNRVRGSWGSDQLTRRTPMVKDGTAVLVITY
jgi:hypothetical protein